MVNTKKVIALLTTLLVVLFFLVNPATAQIVYEYDFESGWGDWYADNGIWDVGEPTYGPDSAHSPDNCAGTILDGTYPYGPDSRLISPTIQLPVVNTDEEIVLRFWQWFAYSIERLGDDYGTVQVRTYENDAWSAWESIGTMVLYSAVWSPDQIDLTEYAGKFIQIGFFHVDRSDPHGHHESSGWYIDDIKINKRTICLLETDVIKGFESGWGCWWTSNGVWEIGEPSSGPGSSYSGSNCAATVLAGNYPVYTDSYLISPPIDLPAIVFPAEILLRFQQWFSYSTERLGDDQGDVRIRTYEEGTWSDWIALKTVFSYITDWHHERIVLNDYAENRVQIAFVHIDRSDPHGRHESSGWYIDEVIIETPDGPPLPPTCNGHEVTILGTEANDKLIGTDGPDVIHGLGGFDIIWGMGGDDVICGGDGTDNISGRAGNDIILGGNSHDSIWGGSGNDTLEGGEGNDSIFGGSGNDVLRGDYGNDSLYGVSGVNELYGGWGPNNGTIDNNDTCYDEAGTFNQGCEVFYEQ